MGGVGLHTVGTVDRQWVAAGGDENAPQVVHAPHISSLLTIDSRVAGQATSHRLPVSDAACRIEVGGRRPRPYRMLASLQLDTVNSAPDPLTSPSPSHCICIIEAAALHELGRRAGGQYIATAERPGNTSVPVRSGSRAWASEPEPHRGRHIHHLI